MVLQVVPNPALVSEKGVAGECAGSALPEKYIRFFLLLFDRVFAINLSNNWQRFNGKLWQRNYWEHIIRNEKSFKNISNYIVNTTIKEMQFNH